MEAVELNAFPIRIKNLKFKYGDKDILKNISLDIEKNKFYTIIGPNGSGKTTLLKNICKILDPEKNSIFIDNIDLTKFKNKELAKLLSCVPQNTNIDFDFSVNDIVLMGRAPYIKRFKSETEKDLEIVINCMKATNILELKDKNITELSGGELQRVIIARALAQQTEIILLDEPTSNLDLHHQIDILDTIKNLTSEITVVSVLHDLNLASQYSDYIILMKQGEIVSIGSPEHVLNKINIKKVYDIDVHIIKHPVTNKPYIIPLSRQNS